MRPFDGIVKLWLRLDDEGRERLLDGQRELLERVRDMPCETYEERLARMEAYASGMDRLLRELSGGGE